MMKILALLPLSLVTVSSFSPRPKPLRVVPLREAQQEERRIDPDLVRDMEEAGRAEREKEDWVAQELNLIGKEGGEGRLDDADWIADDLFRTGQAASRVPHKREKDSTNRKGKTLEIAKDMKQTGKSTDWIERDMRDAGDPDARFKFETSSWWNKLNRELDKLRDGQYEDIKKDMERVGRLGSDSYLKVWMDMEQTGRARNPYDFVVFRDIAYKLGEWIEKAFHPEDIRKDMQAGGKPPDQASVVHDLEVAGREGSIGGERLPDQTKDLKDDLTEVEHDQWIARDMQREGGTAWHTRTDRQSRRDLVSDDMNLVGGWSSAEERIRQDMQSAGHAESSHSYYMGEQNKMSQYEQEVKKFNEIPHAKAHASVKSLQVEQQVHQVEREQETHHASLVMRGLKKIFMPWDPWEYL